jgi:hypothetical protein
VVHREGRWDCEELGSAMEAEFPPTVETNNPFRAALNPSGSL